MDTSRYGSVPNGAEMCCYGKEKQRIAKAGNGMEELRIVKEQKGEAQKPNVTQWLRNELHRQSKESNSKARYTEKICRGTEMISQAMDWT